MAKPIRNSKALKRKKTVQKVIGFTSVILLILLAVVLYYRRDVQHRVTSRRTSNVKNLTVETGSVKTTVSGSGALVSENILDVVLPAGVTVDKILVTQGDDVSEGTMLASVNSGSVLAALADTQSKLDELDEQLRNAGKDAASTTVTAGVPSRIKAVFAHQDDDIAAVMYEHGALALLSLDGKMCVEIEADGYARGDSVTVTTSAGKEYPGTVDALGDGTVTILVTDDGPLYHDAVTVDGKYTGELEIHQPLKVTGYAGTVAYVAARENVRVYNGAALFTLRDTAYSANYDQLLGKRAEYEDTYQELVKLYLDGAVYSPIAGTVKSVTGEESSDVPAASSASSSPMGFDFSAFAAFGMGSSAATAQKETVKDDNAILSIDPNTTMSVTITVDETDILSLEVGQEAVITVESIGEDSYTGIVTDIDTTPTTSGGVTSYSATVTLDRAANMLPGMTADLSVTIQGVENAIVIPDEAVHRTSTTAYVYTTYDEETDTMGGMVEVTTGLTNGRFVEIVEGLKVGDVIYYTPKSQTFSFGNFTVTTSGFRG